MVIEIKQGDTRHVIKAILKNEHLQPIDISNARVRIQIAKGGHLIIDNEMVVQPTMGEAWYAFKEGETDVPGFYTFEIKVVYQDGRIETFPHSGYLHLQIRETIGGF